MIESQLLGTGDIGQGTDDVHETIFTFAKGAGKIFRDFLNIQLAVDGLQKLAGSLKDMSLVM
jgi:hypothetical protein